MEAVRMDEVVGEMVGASQMLYCLYAWGPLCFFLK